jgi:ribosomal protein S18 acetylase RimI-like enzyme
VLADFDRQVRDEQIAALLAECARQPNVLRGLFIALQGKQLRGAILARELAGRTAFVWPPRLVPGASETVADRLLARALCRCRESKIVLAQSLPAVDRRVDRQRLTRAGFHHVAELLYLMCDTTAFTREEPGRGLEFEQYSPHNHERLKTIIQETYRDSRDCPAIDGLREIEDVLSGYRATGEFDPSRWFLVRQGEFDVGCLLLNDHPQSDHWELVYMGVAGSWRGQGIGESIVRHAGWLARQAGRKRIVLSVDAQNEPALAIYHKAGFATWDRRAVFLKSL